MPPVEAPGGHAVKRYARLRREMGLKAVGHSDELDVMPLGA